MAKKTKTFSLEEDMIERIVKYKVDNSLSSDSAALERIILQLGNNPAVMANADTAGLEKLIKKVLEKLDTVGHGINTSTFTESKEIAEELASEGYSVENSSVDGTLSDMMSKIK